MRKFMKAIAAIMLMTAVLFFTGCNKPEDGPNNGNAAPTGAINGKYTINEEGDQVYFSKGNLCYSGGVWSFAEHPWDPCSYFSWATSGYAHGGNVVAPDGLSPGHPEDFYAYGDPDANLGDQTGKADWGYNRISNGGDREGLWRTPSCKELRYIKYSRHTESGILWAMATVDGMGGGMFFPDDWNVSVYSINNPNPPRYEGKFEDNLISKEDWMNVLEPAGCVFFPAVGKIDAWHPDSGVLFWGSSGEYWTASTNYEKVSTMFLSSGLYGIDFGSQVRWALNPVRLACDVK